ncbi:hypothetical protein [Shewanella baltica]|uniref:hypothetical protein n=1 Tax=Shewanella baltica TaxID=62322 RepID=UPI00217D293A|nr:hypothetical protein [Shewanella baltica]MCS6159848.1 hypothetical protein [Shewanella baltica]
MKFDYLAAFPIPEESLPPKLRELLTPVGLSANIRVEVAAMKETDQYGPNAEHLHLQMAVVSGIESQPIENMREAADGVVQFSIPIDDHIGCASSFSPSISGHDYIVAAWGNSSFYSYNLSEKVWMTLGLSPRCVGNDEQRLVYDDLSLPEFDVADGDISTNYQSSLKKNVCWRMSNEYLRRYLWLRGARGVRVFYYQIQLEDTPQIREIMNGKTHVVLHPTEGVDWYELDISEHNNRLLLQLWASVEAVMPERCREQNADGLLWPGEKQPITHALANSLIRHNPVYLDDKFLEKYEQSIFYDTTPFKAWAKWDCSPSYQGQWSFTECQRVGRNLIKVPMRELYKPKPDREIVHAYVHAIDPTDLEHIDLDEEHIVSKVQRLLDTLLNLGDGLSQLGDSIGLMSSAEELTGFSRKEFEANGWIKYPILSRLAQVAPVDMTQQMFLTRCKSMHELLQKIPKGYLKSLLVNAGCPRAKIKDLGNLKLIQSLLNILETLNNHQETINDFSSKHEPEGWKALNTKIAPLFLNNDLRIADAHDAIENCIGTLQKLGFDTANLSTGYGKALDFVMDGVIASLDLIANELQQLLLRNQ